MLTLCMNRRSRATTQFSNFDFNSMVRFQGKTLGATTSGISIIGEDNTDAGAGIDAFTEFPLSELGTEQQKRIRRVYIGGEFEGNRIKVTIKNDEGNSRSYFASSSTENQRNAYASIGRDGKGRYWSTRLENVSGEDFSIDAVTLVIVKLGKKR